MNLGCCYFFKKFILLLVPVMAAAISFSQTVPAFIINNYSTENGIPPGRIFSIHCSDNHFIWILTSRNICRYNGAVFSYTELPHGAETAQYNTIKEDDNGFIYAGANNGIYKIAPNIAITQQVNLSDTFQLAAMLPLGSQSFLASKRNFEGIFKITPGSIKRMEYANDAFFIEKDKEGFIYLFTTGKYIRILKGDNLVKAFNFPGSQNFADSAVKFWNTDLYKARDGYVWCLAGTTCYKLNGSGIEEELPLLPNNDNIKTICYGTRTKKLYAGGDKLYVYDKQNGWRPIPNVPTPIYDIAEDAGGTIWAATAKGITSIRESNLTPTGQAKFMSRPENEIPVMVRSNAVEDFKKKITGRAVYRFYQSSKGMYWAGTDNGLYYYNNVFGKINYYVSNDTLWQGKTKTFNIIRETPSGNIWAIGTNGADVYNSNSESFTHYGPANGLPRQLLAINYDEQENIYAAAVNGLFVKQGEAFKPILQQVLDTGKILNIAKSSGKGVWVLSNKASTIYNIQKRDDNFSIADSVPVTLNDKKIAADFFLFDSQDRLWVTSGHLLFAYLKGNDGKYTNKNRIAIPLENKNYKLRNGTNDSLYINDAEGTLYVFNGNNLVEKYKALQSPVPVPFITSIKIKGLPDSSFSNIGKLSLQYDQNDVRINFITASSLFGNDIVYRYTLKSNNSTIVTDSKTGIAEFANLAPGNYIFTVIASDAQEKWSAPVTLEFSIALPWYRTTSFYLIASLIALLLIGFVVWYLSRAKKRNEERERMLHEQQLIALKAQIDPHFIQNTFSFLSMQIENGNDDTAATVNVVSDYLRNVLNKSQKSVVSLEEELAFAEEYLKMQQILLRNCFEYHIELDDDVDSFGFMLPSMILEPYIENSLKYGINKNLSNNNIYIDIKNVENYLLIEIADSGNSEYIATETTHRISGNTITIKRLNLFYKKSKYPFYFKQLKNKYGGLTVQLYLPNNTP